MISLSRKSNIKIIRFIVRCSFEQQGVRSNIKREHREVLSVFNRFLFLAITSLCSTRQFLKAKCK